MTPRRFLFTWAHGEIKVVGLSIQRTDRVTTEVDSAVIRSALDVSATATFSRSNRSCNQSGFKIYAYKCTGADVDPMPHHLKSALNCLGARYTANMAAFVIQLSDTNFNHKLIVDAIVDCHESVSLAINAHSTA